MADLVFLIGTGRSGTHLVGETIASHPSIEGRIEDPATFPLVTQIATTQDFSSPAEIDPLIEDLCGAYRRLRAGSTADLILEKSHPNIWVAERLAREFPAARFVGVARSPHATVASMLQHDGVRGWYDRLPLDRPNRFLGIADPGYFAGLPIEGKCTLRWVSHHRELERLQRALGPILHRVTYDEFVAHLDGHLAALAAYLGVPDDFARPDLRTESLARWRRELTPQQVATIDRVLGEAKLDAFQA